MFSKKLIIVKVLR